MIELVITIPIPPAKAHPNSRSGHWSQKSRAIKQQRSDAHLAALHAMSEQHIPKPRWPKAQVHATFYKPGRQSKSYDADNAIACLKGSLDGLQDAGVVANDSGLVWLSPVQISGVEAKERKVVLRIRPIE